VVQGYAVYVVQEDAACVGMFLSQAVCPVFIVVYCCMFFWQLECCLSVPSGEAGWVVGVVIGFLWKVWWFPVWIVVDGVLLGWCDVWGCGGGFIFPCKCVRVCVVVFGIITIANNVVVSGANVVIPIVSWRCCEGFERRRRLTRRGDCGHLRSVAVEAGVACGGGGGVLFLGCLPGMISFHEGFVRRLVLTFLVVVVGRLVPLV
jgi:hypothetical protein